MAFPGLRQYPADWRGHLKDYRLGGIAVTVTTTDFVPGMEISEIKDMVFSEQVISVSVMKDLLSGIKGVFGAKLDSYAEEYRKVREQAIDDLKEKAKALGGDAVIQVNVRYDQFINSDIVIITVTAYGTAVTTKPAGF